MRKVILSMMVSVDGFISSDDPEEYWHNWNEEMSAYMMDFLETVDIFIYGRKSYEEMLQYWPARNDGFAKIMNNTPKLVFSNTLTTAGWNATVKTGKEILEIKELKQQEGKNMVLFAGADLAHSFIKYQLIDEFRLIVNPLALGRGKPLFGKMDGNLYLRLIDATVFGCGNILLVYAPDQSTMTNNCPEKEAS